MRVASTLFVILAIFCCAIWFFGGQINHAGNGQTGAPESERIANILPENEQNSSMPSESVDQNQPAQVGTEIPPHLVFAYESWKKERGFTTEYNIYFNQRDFLEQQAANGDPLAAQTLGYMALGTDQGNQYLIDAAVRGSIQALHFLSSSAEMVADGRLKEQRQTEKSDYDQREYSTRALEYLFVAELRRDTFAGANSIAQLMRRQTYTAADVAQACGQARRGYKELEEKRLALGFAPFDNASVPVGSSATKFSELCISES